MDEAELSPSVPALPLRGSSRYRECPVRDVRCRLLGSVRYPPRSEYAETTDSEAGTDGLRGLEFSNCTRLGDNGFGLGEIALFVRCAGYFDFDGVTVATVDGVSAASTACESEVRVTIGGSIGGGWRGDTLWTGPSGLSLGEGRDFGGPFAFGEGDC